MFTAVCVCVCVCVCVLAWDRALLCFPVCSDQFYSGKQEVDQHLLQFSKYVARLQSEESDMFLRSKREQKYE